MQNLNPPPDAQLWLRLRRAMKSAVTSYLRFLGLRSLLTRNKRAWAAAGHDFAGQVRSSSGATLRGTKANTKIEPITNAPAIT